MANSEDERLAMLEILSLVASEIAAIGARLAVIERALDLEYEEARD